MCMCSTNWEQQGVHSAQDKLTPDKCSGSLCAGGYARASLRERKTRAASELASADATLAVTA